MSYSVHARSRQCVCEVREPPLVAYHLSRVGEGVDLCLLIVRCEPVLV